MIRFRCPNCQQKFSVPEAYIGKALVCTVCETKVAVPEESTIAERSAAQPQAAPQQVNIVSTDDGCVVKAGGDVQSTPAKTDSDLNRTTEIQLTPPETQNIPEMVGDIHLTGKEPASQAASHPTAPKPSPAKRFSLKTSSGEDAAPTIKPAPEIKPVRKTPSFAPIPAVSNGNPQAAPRTNLRKPPPLPQPETFGYCPQCNSGLRVPDAVICVECGHNLRSGAVPAPAGQIPGQMPFIMTASDSRPDNIAMAYLVATGAVVVTSLVWLGIAVWLDWVFSWFILIMALVASGTLCLMCPNERSTRLGLFAMGLTSFGWMLSIGLIAGFINNEVKPNYVKTIQDDKVAGYIINDMVRKKEISQELASAYAVDLFGFVAPPKHLQKELEALKTKVNKMAKEMPRKERADLEARIKTLEVQDEPYLWKLFKVISIWDTIWNLLALTIAYKIGAGALSRM